MSASGLRWAVVRALLLSDLRKLGRDPVLLGAALVPVIFALLLRFAVPWLSASLASLDAPFDLEAHRPTLATGALGLSAMMPGWIIGFFLLEERDEDMIAALAVTPLTRRGFLRWRLVLPAILALLGCLLVVGVGGCAWPGLARALASASLAALGAPLFALFLVALADNQVEALALAKIGALTVMLPLLALYLDGLPAALLAVFPPYWAVALYTGGSWWLLPGGLGVNVAWGYLLWRRFGARVGV